MFALEGDRWATMICVEGSCNKVKVSVASPGGQSVYLIDSSSTFPSYLPCPSLPPGFSGGSFHRKQQMNDKVWTTADAGQASASPAPCNRASVLYTPRVIFCHFLI